MFLYDNYSELLKKCNIFYLFFIFTYLHLLLCVNSVFLMKLFRVVYEYRIDTLFGANM